MVTVFLLFLCSFGPLSVNLEDKEVNQILRLLSRNSDTLSERSKKAHRAKIRVSRPMRKLQLIQYVNCSLKDGAFKGLLGSEIEKIRAQAKQD